MKTHSFTQDYRTLQEAIVTDCGVCQSISRQMLDSGMEHPEVRQYKSLWDTGANRSAVSQKVVSDLGLETVAYMQNYTAGGMVLSSNHLVNLVLPNGIEIASLIVSCCDIDGADVLIGMDVINKCDFAITNEGETTTFSFRIPSSGTIDFTRKVEE